MILDGLVTFIYLPVCLFCFYLLHDRCSPGLLLVVCLLPMFPAAICHGYARRRIKCIAAPLTREGKVLHAVLTVLAFGTYMLVIAFSAAIAHEPVIWGLASVVIPVIGVFCYFAVRTNLRREDHWLAKTSN